MFLNKSNQASLSTVFSLPTMMYDKSLLPAGYQVELLTTEVFYDVIWGFPQCAGTMDENHIPIIAPPGIIFPGLLYTMQLL